MERDNRVMRSSIIKVKNNYSLNFQSHVPIKKLVLQGGFCPIVNNGSPRGQKIPDLSSFMEKPNPSVLYSMISFYNQVKLKMFPNSQKILQNLNKLV